MEIEKHVAYTLSENNYENFFNLSEYVLLPKKAWIGVINYEETAMLSRNTKLVYIDKYWFLQEYIRHIK